MPLIVLVGPTAVGKSSMALAVAERVRGEIIAADSMQVYRGLDIGTAKPSADERQRVPHHLLDLVKPDQPFTAADYMRLASAAIIDIRARGRLPIIVGGTGLYVRALFRGLVDGPGEMTLLRETLYQEAERVGSATLHRRLEITDPEAAATIHPNDLFRVVRALEVAAVSGHLLSALRVEGRRNHKPVPGPVLRFGLERNRQELYRRIEARVEAMMTQGLLREVQDLLDRGYGPVLKPLRAIGYRHMIGHLKGQIRLDDAVASLKRDTRRYAKRQLTWFRHEDEIEWLPVEGSALNERVLRLLVERIETAWSRTV
ncbi:MAG: tRNA (adenosine(37)-N6)-dimethylallyltransferase MiaA [Candidatus Methylomirabilis oxygeniifera]|uniref:tRNA dimethylallyltransferase n=1 Tax=Methylomirabilis oxygeniifera TaxID=671143 RepID=D5MF97_METO1|nr:MAG: tRNA (adenosine(37)-N6)-dimethylallyltransferase MiaA [Candidatus Methylomirabilis oxyfera]CBE68426.1 tRNA delta(2)-isopentenylpyrophosphate transferase (IPP transferase) (Isopentenyl-diphosphate:tRNA isopentenyltransferase) (IPTase) (IPPT) [Candidatus Methylomirabilis oxyfera]